MDLQIRLDEERAHWLHQQPAAAQAVEVRALDGLRAAGLESRALRVGERAPPFRLADAGGQLVTLDTALQQGPAVVLFYRGRWCPFCSLTLRAYAARHHAFAGLRTGLIAISPQSVAETAATASALSVPFPLLSDRGNHVSRAFGLAYDLPLALARASSGEHDQPLTDVNADGTRTLPVPASFVIAPGGRVLRAELHVDYRRREDPERLLAFLAQLPDGLWSGART